MDFVVEIGTMPPIHFLAVLLYIDLAARKMFLRIEGIVEVLCSVLSWRISSRSLCLLMVRPKLNNG